MRENCYLLSRIGCFERDYLKKSELQTRRDFEQFGLRNGRGI